jgi:hypothetical protein
MFRCSLYELPTLDNHQCNHSNPVLVSQLLNINIFYLRIFYFYCDAPIILTGNHQRGTDICASLLMFSWRIQAKLRFLKLLMLRFWRCHTTQAGLCRAPVRTLISGARDINASALYIASSLLVYCSKNEVHSLDIASLECLRHIYYYLVL